MRKCEIFARAFTYCNPVEALGTATSANGTILEVTNPNFSSAPNLDIPTPFDRKLSSSWAHPVQFSFLILSPNATAPFTVQWTIYENDDNWVDNKLVNTRAATLTLQPDGSYKAEVVFVLFVDSGNKIAGPDGTSGEPSTDVIYAQIEKLDGSNLTMSNTVEGLKLTRVS